MSRPARSNWQSDQYKDDMYDEQPYNYDDERDNGSSRDQWRSRNDYERNDNQATGSGHNRNRGRYTDYDDDRDHNDYRGGRGRSRSRGRREEPGGEDDRNSYKNNRNRSRSRSPYYGAPPNRTVILEGTAEMSQEDFWTGRFGLSAHKQILHELQKRLQVEGIEEVRLIKDKRTGQSRQFAFAQFIDTPHATRFLESFYPTLSLQAPYDPSQPSEAPSIQIRIAYSREKEDKDRGGREDDWKCEVCHISNFSHRTLCFRCNAPRTRSTANGVVVSQPGISSHSGFATTGDSDVSPDGTASQFLLIRGLEPGTSEELLAKGVAKLYKSKADASTSESRAAKKPKITSTTNDASLGAQEGSIQRVLLVRDRKSGDSWRYGFAEFSSVEEAQAAMVKFNSLDKFTISSKPVLASHIHAGVFIPVLQQVDEELARFTFFPLNNKALRLMYWDESAYVSELMVAVVQSSGLPISKQTESSRLAVAAAGEGLVAVSKNGEPKQKKRKVEKEAKIVAPHLQFWSNQHAELHGKVVKDEAESGNSPTPSSNEDPPTESYADLDRKCCLLCARQFKTEAEVHKHERMSQLHRDNLNKADLVAKAKAKIAKIANVDTDSSAYRDRAKERRQVYNQPKQPAPQKHRLPMKDTKKEEEPAPPVPSKGAALLGKMGWTAGEGLGAQGDGRVDAIQTHVYSQGVGLGAEGGKMGDAIEEAERQTKGGYSDFLDKGKERAKARFESMN